MKICYIWVEHFRNFKRKGINFSSNVKFDFDPEQKFLQRTLLPKLPQNFFDDENRIEEVTGLIGKNGSGKSNSVDLLLKAIKGSSKYLKTDFFIITEENGEYICHKSFIHDSTLIRSDFPLLQANYQGSLENLKVIYFSNVFDEKENLFDEAISDISVNKISHPSYRLRKMLNEKSNFVKQHEFIKSKYFYLLEVDKPYSVLITSKVWLNHRFSTSTLKNMFGQFTDKFIDYRRNMRSRYRETRQENKLLFTLKYSTILESLEAILKSSLSYEIKQDFLNIFFYQSFSNINTREILDNHLHLIKKFHFESTEEGLDNFRTDLSHKISFFEYADSSFFEFNYYNEGDRNKRYEYFEVTYDIFKEIFNDNYSKTFFKPDSYNVVDWVGISSGYKAYFNLYASIMDELRRTRSRNILLCIDEGDLYLHPKWQLEFLDKLLTILPKMYLGRLQLILTSHSPFLLSDLPKQCVTIIDNDSSFIKEDGFKLEIDTFAGNIYNLYAQPFFLENRTVSDFARRKLVKIFGIIENENRTREDIMLAKRLSDLVGDEVLNYQLNKKIKALL
jgi:ABC-type dipeptide/oligopeptide/nickel transport system ATPase component